VCEGLGQPCPFCGERRNQMDFTLQRQRISNGSKSVLLTNV
jgi:sarcosine oxidase delta subunit